jgi:4-hydroxybenzoate polyprenyltransferase
MNTSAATLSPLSRLRTYGSFVRIEHTLFSLPLLLAGIFSAPGWPMPARRWGLIAIAAVGARTTAMALNRLIDRRLDAQNPRTRTRELPAGRMKSTEAWALLAASAAAYLAACAALGPWFLRVAFVPLAVFALYPYLKRFTPLCHFGVGLALALAPLAGYAAAHPGLGHPGPALWLAGFALAWVSGFDIIYATLDEESDRALGVRSMVVSLGRRQALVLSGALHLLGFVCLVLAARAVIAGHEAPPAGLLAALVATLLATGSLLWLEQRWAEDVNLAFFKVNVVVGFGVLGSILVARAAAGGF